MRVYCKECGERGRITKTHHLSAAVADLYCQCTDAECGHSWVATISFMLNDVIERTIQKVTRR